MGDRIRTDKVERLFGIPTNDELKELATGTIVDDNLLDAIETVKSSGAIVDTVDTTPAPLPTNSEGVSSVKELVKKAKQELKTLNTKSNPDEVLDDIIAQSDVAFYEMMYMIKYGDYSGKDIGPMASAVASLLSIKANADNAKFEKQYKTASLQLQRERLDMAKEVAEAKKNATPKDVYDCSNGESTESESTPDSSFTFTMK